MTGLPPRASLALADLFPDPADRARVEEAVAKAMPPETWLQANWRPITMLVFVALIGARWLGLTAPGISEAELTRLWSIVEVSMGAYVVGRSAEKVLPGLVDALTNRTR